MLKKLCSKCKRRIPLNKSRCSKCEEEYQDKKIGNRYYNKYIRDKKSQTFYDSREWKSIRKVVMSRDLGLCLICRSKGVISYADVVHHIIELKEDNSKYFLSFIDSITTSKESENDLIEYLINEGKLKNNEREKFVNSSNFFHLRR